jgi:hypothetical protein
VTLHIIIVANPFQARVAEAYCRSKSINKDLIVLVSLRPVQWVFGQKYLYKHLDGRLSRYLWRVLGISINAVLLNMRLRLSKRNFILIAPWHNEYVETLSAKSTCLGIYYCEEGDLSYWSNNVMFNGLDNNKEYILERRIGPAKRWLFDQNCEGFICTSEDCFPSAKQYLKEIVTLSSSNYCNTTKEGDVIAVLPSAARITKIHMIDLLREYKKYTPYKELDYVKMHPSFNVYPKLESELRKALKLPEFSRTKIMIKNVDLELEILANPLTFIGLDSSVERFALKNGSNYLKVSSLLMLQSDR